MSKRSLHSAKRRSRGFRATSNSACVEALERRVVLAATVVNPLAGLTLLNGASQAITLASHFDDSAIEGTVVEVQTVLGNAYLEMFDTITPITVDNFVNLANDRDFDEMFFHRSDPGFVIQGGGFRFTEEAGQVDSVPNDGTIQNEFDNWYDPELGGLDAGTPLNLRGTLSMAKTAAGPDTATSQFFVNLGDNSANLDNQNGGFTVFAQVLFDGMDLFDDVANLQIVNAGQPFSELPVRDFAGGTIGRDNLIITNTISVVDELSYRVVSNSNPSVLTAAITGGILDLSGVVDQVGQSTVTIEATDLQGNSVQSTFVVNAPGIRVSDVSGSTTEAGGTASLTVVLGTPPTADVQIDVASDDQAEGTVSPATLIFTPSNWNSPQTVTLTGVDDVRTDGDSQWNVVTSPAQSDDADYSGRNARDVAVTNTDDDLPGIEVAGPASDAVEGTTMPLFAVRLTAQPAGGIELTPQIPAGAPIELDLATLDFGANDWDVWQNVRITRIDNSLPEGNLTTRVTFAVTDTVDSAWTDFEQAIDITSSDNDFPLDIDDDGSFVKADATLVIVAAAGFDEPAVFSPFISGSADRDTVNSVRDHINSTGLIFDIDGNGQVSPLTDGILLRRYIAGLRDSELVVGALAVDATVTDPQVIAANLARLVPPPSAGPLPSPHFTQPIPSDEDRIDEFFGSSF